MKCLIWRALLISVVVGSSLSTVAFGASSSDDSTSDAVAETPSTVGPAVDMPAVDNTLATEPESVTVSTPTASPTQNVTASLIRLTPQPAETPKSLYPFRWDSIAYLNLLPDPSVDPKSFIGTECTWNCISLAAIVAVNSIPSPVGAGLFSDVKVVCCVSGNPPTYVFRLAPAAAASYGYSCATGTCVGSAEDVWKAMPAEQRNAYVVAVQSAAQANQDWSGYGTAFGTRHVVTVQVTAGPGQIAISSNHYSEIAATQPGAVRVLP